MRAALLLAAIAVCLVQGAAGSLALADEAIEFVSQWGKKGAGPGEFHSPIGIAIGARDVIHVTDLNNARLQKFDTTGKFLGGFPLPDDTPGKKHAQVPGIAIGADGLIYLSSMLQHKIVVYSDAGDIVRQWSQAGAGPGELNGPGGLVLADNNEIFVADQRNHRVQVFTTEGTFLRGWGGHGSKPGQFGGNEPAGSRFGGPHFIARDSQGRLYTTEGTQARVQCFDRDGKLVATWGNSSDTPGGFGALETGFSKKPFGPIAVMVDREDRVWVSSLNDRVQAYTSTGEFLFGIGESGDGPGEFARPHGMAMDSQGFLYVCDASNQRIQKFRVRGMRNPAQR